MEYADSEAESVTSVDNTNIKAEYDSSEEDEIENEAELLKKESEGFIVDEPEEEGDESDSSQEQQADDDSELDIHDEVEDLLERPKKKRGRLQIESDDDDDNVSEKRFRFTDEVEERNEEGPNLGYDEEEDDDDMGNFIVDGREGKPSTKSRKTVIHDDPQTQEAQELFGVDLEGLEDLDFDEEEYSEDEYDSNDESVRLKKRKEGIEVSELFDPAELDRGFYTAKDEAIKRLDMPERFQLRAVPFQVIDQNSSTFINDMKELEEEAKWIYQQHFAIKSWRKDEVTDIIKEVLNLLKVHLFEPPFIATYRKEYIESTGDFRFTMSINDLWDIYFLDEQWIRLTTKRKHLIQSLEKLIKILEKIKDSSLEENDLAQQLKIKLNISDLNPPYELLEFVKKADSMELLKDCSDHFNLHYKSVKEVDIDIGDSNIDENAPKPMIKPSKTNPFSIGRKSKLSNFMRYFGLSSTQFAEHVRDQYAMNEVDHCPMTPNDAAEEFICSQFPTKDAVLVGVRAMLAYQMFCEPEVRKNLRQRFLQEAFINVSPTKKGKDEIDEHHPMFPMKYLVDKPISSLEDTYKFLYIENAFQDHLINYKIILSDRSYNDISDKYKSFFHRDEYNIIAQQWNEQRAMVIKQMLDDFLIPLISKEVKHKLIKDAQDSLTQTICERVYNAINMQPFIQSTQKDSNYDDRNSYGRILSVTYYVATNRNEESYALIVVIDGNGEVIDRLKLTNIMYTLRRRNFQSEAKTKDLDKLSDLIIKHRPHAVAIATDSLVAADLQHEVSNLISNLENQHDLNPIPVELVDNEISIIYQNRLGETEFPNYPSLLRQAVSIGRRLQDPLTEFSQLMNVDQDLMNLRFHPLQEMLSRDNLYRKLEIQFVNTVNSVGVDINDCIIHKHRSGVLQFVSGLGSRKADYLIKTIKKNLEILSSRNLIIQQCEVGPKVGMNCLGFIKINHLTEIDFDDAPREVLDSTRIHPESYDLAKKMAIDALEWDDRDNQAAALEEIMESPEKLRDLDLEAFAEELKRTEHGSKHITLNDIRKELTNRFEDLRPKFRSLDPKERFELLSKETSETLDVGSLVQVRVVSLAHRKPQQDQLDHASPKRNESTGYWICPFCQQENFVELNNVWQHFDSQECPGKIVGVYCELHNHIRAFLATKNISDNHVSNIQDRVEVDMVIYGRVIRIDYDRLQVEISTKSSDLKDENRQWKKSKDMHYDELAEDAERRILEEKVEKQKKVLPYVSRVIFHPQFKNITYTDFEKLLPKLEVGEFIIRPSSRGPNHLSISWKLDEDVVCHIDVLEEDKDNDFSLGRTLIIDDEKFEDLDEIIASYIQPMSNYVRDAQNFKYYKRVDGDNSNLLIEMIRAEKAQAPNKIPYFLAPLRKFPGRFCLVYMPETKERIEFFKITPKGYLFRNIYFNSFVNMIAYFKTHFNERPSNRTTPGTNHGRTPMIGSTPTFATPVSRTPKEGYNKHRGRQGPETPSF